MPLTNPMSQVVDGGPATWDEPMLPGFCHAFETVNGVRLHYVASARTSADVVVLLAGFPQSWYAWRKVMPLLAARYHVIAPDLPGQGDSDRPLDGYDTETLSTAVHGLLRQLSAQRYFLVGHDIGAWVAYTHAARFGDEVRRLVLMDAGIPGITLPEALSTAPDRVWRTWHFAFHMVADLPEVLLTGHEREYIDWFLRRKAASPAVFSESDLDEYLRTFRKDGGLRAGLAFYRAVLQSAQQNKALAARVRLAMPVLAIGADQGSIADMATPLAAVAEEVIGVTIRHCGHFIQEEQPIALTQALMAFFG